MKWSNDGSSMTLRDKVTIAASLAIIVIFMWLITGEFHQLSEHAEDKEVLLTDSGAGRITWDSPIYTLGEDPTVWVEMGKVDVKLDDMIAFWEAGHAE